ncbi:FGGY-family carbohydrate kinase [Cryobacterium sp. Hh38]|uniref:xylulokinase n=1 Tax=Cryobacterium sp. Hh38 TaxID=1259156 RepID=UPI00106CA12C|nr:FGGY family carbohydrate kinase [Cryobacterium sp. Hh38]TFD63338.1 carbohydrate kinase [Cryobacterium sp. Hh38]
MKQQDLVVSVDCSTTGVKCVIWDSAGQLVGDGRSTLDLSIPSIGYGEQDPRQWWSAMCIAVTEAVRNLDTQRIAAICVTHQRESFACLDDFGEPIRPAMLWLDARATEEVESAGTQRVHDVTGKPPNTTPAFYKLLWLQKHEPETLRQTRHVVDVHGYLVHKMTDQWRTSVASADPLGLVNLNTADYDDELVAQVGLHRNQLSTLFPPGTVLGELRASAGSALGLPAGLRVVAGAGDGQAAGLGAGIIEPGRAYLNLGTGLVAGTYSDIYAPNSAYRALTGPIAGTFTFESFIGAGTYVINWFIDTFVQQSPDAAGSTESIEQRLEREAVQVAPGSGGLLVVPYWNGALTPYWDHNARGIILGLTGIHSRAHIYRAVLEGLAYELRLCFDRVELGLSDPITVVVAMGGGSQSALWCQILADVLRRPIVISGQQESTCLGAGMLAAAGAGLYPSVRAACSAMTSLGERFDPNEELSQTYDRFYTVYQEIYPSVRPVFTALKNAMT